jgi:hypothetical protein
VDVQITELDIAGASQADGFATVVRSCLAVSRCAGITVCRQRQLQRRRRLGRRRILRVQRVLDRVEPSQTSFAFNGTACALG